MHEYGMMEEVVKSLLAKLDDPEVDTEGAQMEVVLKVGALAIHSAAATRQAYEVLVKGTKLETSRLNLIVEPLILTCAGCGFTGPLPEGDLAALISMLTTQALFSLGLLQVKGQE